MDWKVDCNNGYDGGNEETCNSCGEDDDDNWLVSGWNGGSDESDGDYDDGLDGDNGHPEVCKGQSKVNVDEVINDGIWLVVKAKESNRNHG